MTRQRLDGLEVGQVSVVHAYAVEVVGHFVVHHEVGLESRQGVVVGTAVNEEDFRMVRLCKGYGSIAAVVSNSITVDITGRGGSDIHIVECQLAGCSCLPFDDGGIASRNIVCPRQEKRQRAILLLGTSELHQFARYHVILEVEWQAERQPAVGGNSRTVQHHLVSMEGIQRREAEQVAEHQPTALAAHHHIVGGLSLAGWQIDKRTFIKAVERRILSGAVNGEGEQTCATGHVEGCDFISYTAEGISTDSLQSQLYVFATDGGRYAVGHFHNASLTHIVGQGDILVVYHIIIIYSIGHLFFFHIHAGRGAFFIDLHLGIGQSVFGGRQREVGFHGMHTAVCRHGVAYGHQLLLAVLQIESPVARMEGDVSVLANLVFWCHADNHGIAEGWVGNVFALVPAHQIGLACFYLVSTLEHEIQRSGGSVIR